VVLVAATAAAMTTQSPYQVRLARHARNPHPIRSQMRALTPFLVILLAAILRFYHLSNQSLWADEGNSIALTRYTFTEIAQRTAFDIHPPFYYWLLKIWVVIFSDSEFGLRSLSVLLAASLVYLTGLIGTYLFSRRVGLLAAFISALSPLQVYYAQEARMYMLLTFLSSLTILTAWFIWRSDHLPPPSNRRPTPNAPWYAYFKQPLPLIYIVTVTAGLYTHYAYPLILLLVNGMGIWWIWSSREKNGGLEGWKVGRLNEAKPLIPNSPFTIRHSPPVPGRVFAIRHWLLLQLIPLLLYLPWLPTAWRQLTTWPTEQHSASLAQIVGTISTTLLFGLSWPFNQGVLLSIGLGLAILISGLAVFRRQYSVPAGLLVLLWLTSPIALTVITFSPAFLKFLLAASPALALLLALSLETSLNYLVNPGRPRPGGRLAGFLVGASLLALVAAGSLIALYHYFFTPTYARDNYRAIAGFISALAGPQDAVILNAEGQQDVFNYYYSGSSAPVYPLPRRRPLDEAATLAELEQIAASAKNVYAVYWASQQADPQGLIENWLNSHLFKASDQWYGNVRLVNYAGPAELPLTPLNYRLGTQIRLVGAGLSTAQVRPGEILQVALAWQVDAALKPGEDYTVFIQALDPANHVVGQRDASPRRPTSTWPVNQPLDDAHGLFIEPGTPPGPHQLIVGLYNSQTGQRLPVEGGGDFIPLGPLDVVAPATPLPKEALKIQIPLDQPMLEVTLLGYDLYKVGHRSAPETPLHPGDPVQLVLYWRADRPISRLSDQLFIQVVTLGGAATPVSMTRQPAGTNYPIDQWQPGEIIRAQHNFFLQNLAPGTYRLALTLDVVKTSSQRVVALTQPFQIKQN
jgi:4-amino-4-deoxy-L-arabinose transferase-like glycosyltransferase